jgi:hypothetical protein
VYCGEAHGHKGSSKGRADRPPILSFRKVGKAETCPLKLNQSGVVSANRLTRTIGKSGALERSAPAANVALWATCKGLPSVFWGHDLIPAEVSSLLGIVQKKSEAHFAV